MTRLFVEEKEGYWAVSLGKYSEFMVAWIKGFDGRTYEGNKTKVWRVPFHNTSFFSDLMIQIDVHSELEVIIDDVCFQKYDDLPDTVKIRRYSTSRFLFPESPFPRSVYDYLMSILPSRPKPKVDGNIYSWEGDKTMIKDTYRMVEHINTINRIVKKIGLRLQVHVLATEVIRQNKKFYEDPEVPLEKEPYDFQKYNINFLLRGNKLDATETGLGKSVDMIGVIAKLMEERVLRKTLIVCPKNVLSSWEERWEEFYPKANVQVISSAIKPDDRPSYWNDQSTDVFIINYHLARRELPDVDVSWDGMVLDECQYIGDYTTKTARVLKKIRPMFRWALSATPVENHPKELYSIMSWLKPSVFGSYQNFRDKYYVEVERETSTHTYYELKGFKNLADLSASISDVVVRQVYDNVKSDLPELIEETVRVGSTPDQRRLDRAIRKAIRKGEVEELACISAFRQVANDPRILWESSAEIAQILREREKPPRDKPSPKTSEIINRVIKISEQGSKVIIFSEFVEYLKKIKEAMREEGILNVEYHGGVIDMEPSDLGVKGQAILKTHKKNRETSKKIFFEDEDVTVLLASDSISTGTDGLQKVASYAIHADLHWNPSKNKQRIGRIRRVGQKAENIVLYTFVSEDLYDEYVLETVYSKEDVFNQVMSDSATATQKLNISQVMKRYVNQ